MEYLFNGLWSAIDIIFFHHFWTAFLSVKMPRKQHFIVLAALFIGCVLNTSFVSSQTLKQIISFGMFLSVSVILYKGAWYQQLFFLTLGLIANGAIDTLMLYGVSALLGISYSDLVWRKMTYIVVVSSSKLISVLLAWVLRRTRQRNGNQAFFHKWLLLALLFPVISCAMMLVVFNSSQTTQDLSISAVIFSCFLAAANIAIIYLIGIMEKTTQEAQENALLHQRMEIQTGSILALEKSYRNQRKTTHEYQNQLQTIYNLLLRDNPTAAIEYIRQLQGMQTARIFAVNSHHPIIDAILNQKYQTAKEHEIDFQIHLNDLSVITIDTNALVVLLSNLLDNAIEACTHLSGNRTIQCHILAEDTVFISIRNTSLPVTIIGNTIPTTKEPRSEHGFGIPHIQLILNQLHAEYTFAYEDGWFEFVAELPVEVKTGS